MIYWVEVKYEEALSNWSRNLQDCVRIIPQQQGFNRFSTEEEKKKKSLHYPAYSQNGKETVEWLPVSDRGIYSALMPWVFWPAALRASTGPYRLLPLWKVGLWWRIDLSSYKATYKAGCLRLNWSSEYTVWWDLHEIKALKMYFIVVGCFVYPQTTQHPRLCFCWHMLWIHWKLRYSVWKQNHVMQKLQYKISVYAWLCICVYSNKGNKPGCNLCMVFSSKAVN